MADPSIPSVSRPIASLQQNTPTVDETDSLSEQLKKDECWWRDNQTWLLKSAGYYKLRPRYEPDRKPTWKGPQILGWRSENAYRSQHVSLLQAVRVADNSLVMLKRIRNSWVPQETPPHQFLHEYLLSEPLRSDPRNHTIPLLEALVMPYEDFTILVLPLFRACDEPAWLTVGEVVAFIAQVFEGAQFMHEHKFAHGDCQLPIISYDPGPLYPDMLRPIDQDRSRSWKGPAGHSTRTLHPVKYYFIDFGLSHRAYPEDGPPLRHPIIGGDKSVPEFQNWNGELLDPFPTDVYCLGNMVRKDIMTEFRGIDFLTPLVRDMVQDDPSKRPTMQDVVRRFDELVSSLKPRTLRSRLVPRKEDPRDALFRRIAHAARTARYVLTRKPAIPL